LEFLHWYGAIAHFQGTVDRHEHWPIWLCGQHDFVCFVSIVVLLPVHVPDSLHHQGKVASLSSGLCQTSSGKSLDIQRAKGGEADGNSVHDASSASKEMLAKSLQIVNHLSDALLLGKEKLTNPIVVERAMSSKGRAEK
jgi:hypothetical protein